VANAPWKGRPRPPLALIAMLAACARLSLAHDSPATGYAPCHLLCSTDAGRVESLSGRTPEKSASFGFQLETIYLSPLGLYEDGRYVPRAGGSHVEVLQILPVFWWRPKSWLQLSAGIPWELNHARGVVLPTLHPVEGSSSEFAPGGLFLSVQGRLPLSSRQLDSWIGLGYKLSSSVGTVDVSGDVAEFPDKAVEGLGVGSDDLYFTLRNSYSPAAWPKWSFGASGELRLHMLPRWERLFATTAAYQVWAERALSSRWSASLGLSGYSSDLRTLDLTQRSLLILTPSVTRRLDRHASLSVGFSAEVPGTAINQNALQTLGLHVTLATEF
jgi:hypothetical protein